MLFSMLAVMPFMANSEESGGIKGDVNGDGEVNIADVNTVIVAILNASPAEATDVNNDGEVNIADINAVIDIILYGSGNEGSVVEITEMEEEIAELTSDEDAAPEVVYSEADSLMYDELAQDVLNVFAPEDSDENEIVAFKMMRESEDDLAEEAIRNNGNNIFRSSGLIIEQQDWDSGLWGKTRYGGFETYYNTHVKNGKRCLLVVFYHKGGFPNAKTAYLKLGQVNSGKILGKITIPTNKEYAYLDVQIDDYLNGHGCVNFFPLVINNASKAREYINPIMVKTDPIVDDGWKNKYYGYEFGTINGVSVYYNNNYTNAGDGHYQCVELCIRYVTLLNANINRTINDIWGDANLWPYNRAHDKIDPGEYIVFANDGGNKVREGDLIVWDYGKFGHIGVVIKTTATYISVAHQNGGTGQYALPIGSTLKIENGVVKDIKPGTNRSPIFASSHPIPYFIRINNDAENIEAYSRSMKASTTEMQFKTEVGKSQTKKFWVKNSGYSPLTISSMTLANGKAFQVNESSCTINPGVTKEFEVTFTPTTQGEYEDRLVIRSDADDNPSWLIHLSGTGIAQSKEAYAVYTPSNTTLSFYCDNKRSTRTGTTYDLVIPGSNYPMWHTDDIYLSVTRVVFDPSFAEARPTTTRCWFYHMTSLESITGINYLNTSEVTHMGEMFYECSGLTSLDVSHFNTAKVTHMGEMFYECSGLTSLDVSNFNTAKVTNMSHMFCDCRQLTSIDVSHFNTANVTSMWGMFWGCSGLTSLDVSHFNTANVTDMCGMFCKCSRLSSLDLSHFNTAKVTDIMSMFNGCSNLTSLDLSSFNTANLTAISSMFRNCSNLTTIYVSNGWSTAKVTYTDNLFWNCIKLVGGKGTTYDANHTDISYAHIDGGSSNPGYFTGR